MAWKIAQKDDQYRIWSTVSDQWITDWISRTEAIAIYYDDALCQFKKKVIEKYFSFPHHWGSNDGLIHDEEGHQRLLAWMKELSTKRDDEYYQYIDETFEKIREELTEHHDKEHSQEDIDLTIEDVVWEDSETAHRFTGVKKWIELPVAGWKL